MANFHTLASAEPAAAPASPEPAVEPEVETPEVADETLAEADPEVDESDDTEPEAEEEPAGLTVDPEAEYLVDGELVKGKDLLGQRLMQADYTRKTQALAEASKAMRDRAEKAEDDKDDLVSWAESLQSPARMEYELATNFPEAFEALKESIIEQALAEAELAGKPELQYFRDSRKAALEREAQKAQKEADERAASRTGKRQQVAEMRTTFEGWTKSAMESAGLDPNNATQRTAVQDRLMAGHRDEKWTQETFATAAKHVAKLTGAKAPQPKPAESSEEKPKLPPVRPAGHKAKPAQRVEQEKARVKAQAPKSFDQLRRKFGAF